MSPTERGRAVIASGLVLLLGGCSWIPFLGDSAPHLTNPAVAACEHKADSLGYDGVGERQSAPESNGRYTVILDVLQNQGYGQVSCTYDPAKGADLAPPVAAQK
jgi:hypothetical protein